MAKPELPTRITADTIRTVRFRERIRGYDPTEVDPLLELIAAELERGGSVLELVRHKRFGQKWRGYHPEDVDALLNKIRHG